MIDLHKEEIQTENKVKNFICGFCGNVRPIAERITTPNYSLCRKCQVDKGLRRRERITLDLVRIFDRTISDKDAQELASIKTKLYNTLYRIKYRNNLVDEECPPIDDELDSEIGNAVEGLLDYAQVSEIELDNPVPEYALSKKADEIYINGELYRIDAKNYIW